ncbi:FG-GAP-like repeat-containing protein [Taibaiella koreensis]|uniref:FG-GAP-like repeat-containing protein n=1 Tax=Taibaiella koreensis TaxID=1268548 RepID=UPI000E59E6AA|nr:FG-GAP-like repeat-containing protein [Taibaiella koreensis]
MTYTYAHNATTGEVVLQDINYTGNTVAGTLPQSNIHFDYAPRSDAQSVYVGGGKLTTTLKLNSITCSQTIGGTAHHYRTYGFDYSEELFTHLETIKVRGQDDVDRLTSTQLTYGNTVPPSATLIATNQLGNGFSYVSGDYNGDGLSDYVRFEGTTQAQLFINTGTGIRMTPMQSWALPVIQAGSKMDGVNYDPQTTNKPLAFFDYNGDGLEDLCYMASKERLYPTDELREKYCLMLSNGYQLLPVQSIVHPVTHNELLSNTTPLVGDFDGDGKTEILLLNNQSYNPDNNFLIGASYCTNQSGMVLPKQIMDAQLPFDPYDAQWMSVIDYDGDGKSDLAVKIDNGLTVYKFNITFDANNQPVIGSSLLTAVGFTNLNIYNDYTYRIYPRDFNGDKITDIMIGGYYTADWTCSWKIYYGKGDGSFDDPVAAPYLGGNYLYTSPGTAPMYLDDPKENFEEKVVDLNGDGKCDIYVMNSNIASSSPFQLYYGRGNNTFNPPITVNDPNVNHWFSMDGAGDYDGDGMTDFLYWDDFSSTDQKMISFNPKEKRHLLSVIQDGLGAKTRITYDYLSNPGVYDPGGASYTLPFVKKTVPFTVASVVNRDNGVNTAGNNIIYTYTGLKFHLLGKGTMGFDIVNRYDVAADLDYSQSYGLNATYAFPYPTTLAIRQHSTSNSVSSVINTFNVYHYGDNRIFSYISQTSSNDYLANTSSTTTYNYTTPFGLPGGPPSSMHIGKPMSIRVNKGNGLDISTQTFTFPNMGSNPLYRYTNPTKVTATATRQGQAAYTRITDYTYNVGNGLPATAVADPGTTGAITTTYSYDVYGNPLQKATSGSNVPSIATTTTYDPTNRFGASTYNNAYPGIVAQSIFDPVSGNVTSTLAPDGFTAAATYNGFGKVKLASNSNGVTSTTIYGPASGFTGIAPAAAAYGVQTTPNTAAASYKFYDRLNRLVRTAYPGFDGTPIFEDITYNALGQTVATTKPYFSTDAPQTISYTYDSYGRQVQIAAPEGNATTSYQYSNGLYKVEVTNAAGQKKATFTDPSGKAKSTSDDISTLEYTYHSNGQVKETKLGGVITLQTDYDSYGRKIAERDPNYGGSGAYQYTYNTYGQLLSQKDPHDQTYLYTGYDVLGNLLSKTGPEGNYTYTYSYVAGADCGKLVQHTGPLGVMHSLQNHMGGGLISETMTNSEQTLVTAYTYDNKGRVATKTFPNSTQVVYTYNNADGSLMGIGRAGDQVSIFAPGGAQTQQGQLYNIMKKDALGHTVMAGYKSVDVPGSVSAGNPYFAFSMGTTQTYDAYGLLQEQLSKWETLTTPPIIHRDEQYQFEQTTGNLQSRKDVTHNLRETFSYDNLNRLTGFLGSFLGPNPYMLTPVNMDYADNGNIKTKSDAGDFRYDQANRISRIDSYIDIPEEEQDVTYTPFNKVSEITEGDDKVHFEYWNDGNRSTMKYYHAGVLLKTKYYAPLFEREVDNITGQTRDLCYIVGPEGNIVSILEKQNGIDKKYFVLTDHQGSLTHIVDENGTLVEEKSFDAWGRPRNPANWINLPPKEVSNGWDRGYTGHEHIPQFGIINMNGRLYDPLMGRMFSPDPNIAGNDNTQGYNRYSYALNNPLKYTDPTGYMVDYSETMYRQRNMSILNELDQWGILSWWAGGGGPLVFASAEAILNRLYSRDAFNDPYEDRDRQAEGGGVKSGLLTGAGDAIGVALAKDGSDINASPHDNNGKARAPRKLGIFTIHEDNSFFNPSLGLVGADFMMSYDGKQNEYYDYQWFQTVITDNPMGGAQEFKIDRKSNQRSIFYSHPQVQAETEEAFRSRGYVGGFQFSDFPTRHSTKDISWEAELSLIGISVDGSYHRLETIKWGFSFDFSTQKPTFTEPSIVKPSFGHQFIINNAVYFERH